MSTKRAFSVGEAIPPFDKFPNIRERIDEIHVIRFDVATMVETKLPADTKDVQNTVVYRELMELLKDNAKHLLI
jgi:hypothetical protein